MKCSACCRFDPGVVCLTKDDLSSIAAYLNMPERKVIKDYCRPIYKGLRRIVSLRERANYDCVFWHEGCVIYEARPLQCRTYPFWPSVVSSKKDWNEESKRCKGIGKKGDLTTKEKIKYYEEEKEAEYTEYIDD